jgi:hypothetical protein
MITQKQKLDENAQPVRDVVPGTAESYHSISGAYGTVGLKVKATKEQYEQVKGNIDASIAGAEPETLAKMIRVTYNQQKGYIDFSLQGYPLSQDNAAVCLLTSLSDLTYKSINGDNLLGAPKVGLVKTYAKDTSSDNFFGNANQSDNLFENANQSDKTEMCFDKNIMPVQMNRFGELTEATIGLGFNKMETWGIGPCVALVLVGGKDGAILLAHISSSERLYLLRSKN